MKTAQYVASTLFGVLALGAGAVNAEAASANDWEYGVTIYGWLPSVDGSTLYSRPPGSGGDVGVDGGTILDNLKMTFMGTFEARRDKWSFLTDVIYLRLGDEKDTSISVGPGIIHPDGITLSANVNQDFKAWMVTGAVGYNLIQTEKAQMDVIGGLRYLSVDADASISPDRHDVDDFDVSVSETLWDGIVGVRGKVNLTDKWFIPYYADVGTGSADLTWQALAGIGYSFDWGDIKLAYRHLSYDQGGDKLLQDVSFSGAALGVGFHF